MDDKEKAAFESQSTDLRAELKSWETAWAKSHDGKKPGRDDIKRNPDIAQKYKQYNKIRDIISGKIPPPATDDPNPKKRKPAPAPVATPLKRQKHTETPSKGQSTANDYGLMSTPSTARTLFSPAAPRSIGPTPQRDGRVLGLFDLKLERELGTPSRSNRATNVTGAANLQETPRKQSAVIEDGTDSKLGRTPMSTSKRQMLDNFMTPLKKKDGNPQPGRTPTSVSKLQFSTPAFLKRHTLPPVDENGGFASPAPLRLPRKPLVRGLSSIVASLRKVEEEKLDDDLEALREIENEEMGVKPAPKPKQDILVPDSQAQNLPLGGFDDEGMFDGPIAVQLDRGQPLRVYQKKGQKRTTRRSNMKPVRNKRLEGNTEGDASDDEDADGVVPKTQVDGNQPGEKLPDLSDMGSDYEDGGSDAGAEKAKKPKKAAPKTAEKKEGTIKKAARKVNELAHTNFRRLKLRNNGAKGGPGFNSKFRRRR